MNDVIIIGAGLAGLSAARYLSSQNVKTVVLEARKRVGGRTLSQQISSPEGDLTIDLGGQWVGPTQKRTMSLINEFGLPIIKQTWNNAYPEDLGQAIGLIRLTAEQEQAVIDVFNTWDQIALELDDLDKLWSDERLNKWSEMTVADYIDNIDLGLDDRLRQDLKLQVLTLTGCDPENLSLLHWLLILRSIPGGSGALDDGDHGAQHYKIAVGSQQLSILLAEHQDVRLDDALVAVDYTSPSEIVLTLSSGKKLICRRLLLAFSPTLLSKVSFAPSIPLKWHSNMTMGQCIKTIFLYKTPFWRGVDTKRTKEQGPCKNIFELDKPTALIGLILGNDAAYWCNREENELIEAIIKQYNELYHVDHRPIRTFVQYWPKEEWSKGCYAGVYPSSPLHYWKDKRKNLIDGRIWLASTEMATEWIGYMEGAIEAGECVAKEIYKSLSKYS